MTPDGAVSVVTETSQGVGHLTHATAHEADKSIIYSTDAPGIAVLDTVTSTLQNLDISFTSNDPDITSIAVYGNRLYVYDAAADNVYGFSKTLSGYVNGTPWITDTTTPKDTIVSIAIDGSVYTLHRDGRIHELFKGEATDVAFEAVEPSLAGATAITTIEAFKHVYVFDPLNKRIVIFGKDGTLVRQLFIDVAQDLKSFTVTPDEQTVYVLDGTRVLAVPIATAS